MVRFGCFWIFFLMGEVCVDSGAVIVGFCFFLFLVLFVLFACWLGFV